jgi:eukaryotic-like serine/threonine-protein kinase
MLLAHALLNWATVGITSLAPERPTAAARPGAGARGGLLDRRPAGGRYVLGDLLGRGGMAEVFSGHALGSLGFQKPVAIKRLLPERARDEEFVGRLVAEAKLLVGLQHTNVISVLDLVRDGDDVFLVMEFVDGPSLRQLINVRRARKGGPVPLGLAAYVVQAACAGLEYAHARPTGAIIHADVSPSNVLLTKAGEVKVADFGIARREGIAAAVEGKWAYMPPEQARGEALTPRSDEFALGVVLYELLTGVHPFARRVSENGREDGAVENVRPPRALRPEIPLHLEAACLRAMAPDPADRYSRLQQLHDALAEIRFACGWREGAAELAAIIAECGVGAGDDTSVDRKPAPARTQVTQHPVTLVTKSLLEGSHSQSGAAAGEAPAAIAAGTMHAAPEPTTPHAWTSETAPARGRWRTAAMILGVAAVVGAAIAATIVTRSPQSVAAETKAPVASPESPTTITPLPAPITVTEPITITKPVADEIQMEPSVVQEPKKAVPHPAKRVAVEKPSRAKQIASRVSVAAADDDGDDEEDDDSADAETGTVRIYAKPWAYVEAKGKRRETPTTLTLPVGVHDISLYNPELDIRKTVTVTIRPGKPKTLNVRLVP